MTLRNLAYLCLLALPAFGQGGPAQPPPPSTVSATIGAPGLTSTTQSQYQGSTATGQATQTAIMLSLQDAIARGLKTNLGLLVRGSGTRLAQAERIRALSALLPNVAGGVSETDQQIDLASFGFHFPGVPSVIGPFSNIDARVSAGQRIFDWTALKNKQSAEQNVKAAQLSLQDGRDLVVQAVASAYLQIIADAALVEATRAQVATAQALYERARDQHTAGVSPAIDELRSQVELKTQQQRLLSQLNSLAKDKLALARVIGLPSGQPFEITDTIPYKPLEGLAADEALRRALGARSDYQSALMQVQAAETSLQAVRGERYPTLSLAGNYGDIGLRLDNSHGTFAVTGSLKFNIFDGGKIRADILQADAVIQQRKDELTDLQGQIDFRCARRCWT